MENHSVQKLLSLWLIVGLFLLVLSGCGGGGGGPSFGTLEVNSNPQGSRLFLDGKDVNLQTPAVLKEVTPGSHQLRLQLSDSRTATLNVVVSAREVKQVSFDFTQKGTLQIEVPTAPKASQSLLIRAFHGQEQLAAQRVTRSGGGYSATMSDLPAGDVTLSLLAYPNTEGTGTPVATQGLGALVDPSHLNSVQATLVSTITRLSLTPQNLKMLAQESAQLTVKGLDAQQREVVVVPEQLQWEIADPTVVSLDTQTWQVVGRKVGRTQIVVTDLESGKTASTTVTVQDFPPPPN